MTTDTANGKLIQSINDAIYYLISFRASIGRPATDKADRKLAAHGLTVILEHTGDMVKKAYL